MSHDIHQYYFERYLRQEMPEADRLAFEQKLAADPELRSAFHHYRTNRGTELRELSKERDTNVTRTGSRLNSIIYLLISVIGIVLSINFYLDNRELRAKQQHMNASEKKVSFWERLPFIGRKQKTSKAEVPPAPLANDTITPLDDDFLEEKEEVETPELSLMKDVLLHDTFVTAFEYSRLNADTIMTDTTALSRAGHSRQQEYFVEFWMSPINYYGYKFTGKKLQLFGVSAPYSIYLLREEDALILRISNEETRLVKDNDFHKL